MEYPKRKRTRLKQYDYSTNGAYFVTICTDRHKSFFAHISPVNQEGEFRYQLTPLGEIAAKILLEMEQRFPDTRIDKYVIMPNHLHAIIMLEGNVSGKPTLSDIICAFKSLTTRECKRSSGIEQVFQKSYHDHIIRDQRDYEMIWQYIDSNPRRWREDCFYEENQK